MDRYYLITIANMGVFKPAQLAALLKRFAGAGALWRADTDALYAAGVSKETVGLFSGERRRYDPDSLEEFCLKENVRVITAKDKDYPSPLLHIANPPPALFVKGGLSNHSIAIVGSRKASSYGRAAAKQFAADLAGAGFSIVSGGAKGIDSAAHEGALSAKGHTVAVFGCGIDVCYPKENQRLYDGIVEAGGGLISEYLPGDMPVGWHFPVRNRIISGLSKGVLVVEAHKKSGSLLTADLALEAGREVYCVPGSIYSPGSAGVHGLIKQGARLVDCPEDITGDLFNLFSTRREQEDEALSEGMGDIYSSLVEGRYYTLDEIADTACCNTLEAAEALLALELSGCIEASAGLYKRRERGGK